MADPLNDGPLKSVQLEALAVMRIIKHCAQTFPTPATGFLVGMDVNSQLQASNAFPFPHLELPNSETSSTHHDASQASNLAAAAPRAKVNTLYQAEMIRQLREVNIDANCVGWYTSANMGNFINLTFIENQFHYQKELNERTVAIVHDVGRSSQGSCSLRAFRLSPSFMQAYKEGKFTTENLQKSSLRYTDVLLELPLQIHTSHLLTSYLHQLPQNPTSSSPPQLPTHLSSIQKPIPSNLPLLPNFDALDLSIDPFLTKTSDLLLDSIEAHHTELNNYQYYQRSLGREQAKISAWQAKRKAENASRTLSKQPLLPEDEWQRLFKVPTEPSRLEVLLNTRQVEWYSRMVDGFVGGVSGKMFAVRGGLGVGGGVGLEDGDGKDE